MLRELVRGSHSIDVAGWERSRCVSQSIDQSMGGFLSHNDQQEGERQCVWVPLQSIVEVVITGSIVRDDGSRKVERRPPLLMIQP